MIYEILELLLRSGFRPSKPKMLIVYQYFLNMMKAGRVITFREQDELIGFCTYSMTNAHDAVYEKSMWDYVEHNEEGKGAYIEMIVSYKWDKKLRLLVEEAIAKKYPNFEYGVWHRPTENHDRMLIVRRKHNVPSKDPIQ